MKVELQLLEVIRLRELIATRIKKYEETRNLVSHELYKNIDEHNEENIKLLDKEIEGLNKLLDKLPL